MTKLNELLNKMEKYLSEYEPGQKGTWNALRKDIEKEINEEQRKLFKYSMLHYINLDHSIIDNNFERYQNYCCSMNTDSGDFQCCILWTDTIDEIIDDLKNTEEENKDEINYFEELREIMNNKDIEFVMID